LYKGSVYPQNQDRVPHKLKNRIVWPVVVVAALMVAAPAQSGSTAAATLSRAHAMHQKLLQEPVSERTGAEYEAIVTELAPLWADPQAPDADSARYQAANVYIDWARDLHASSAYTKAARVLLDLLHASPYSSFRRNAEWALAQIQYFHLHQAQAAAVWLRDFEKRYPADPRTAIAHKEVRGEKVAEPEYFEASGAGAGVGAGAAGVPARLMAAASEPQQDLAVSIGNVSGVHVFTHASATTVVVSLRGEADFTRGAVAERHLVYFDVSTAGAPTRPGEPAPASLNVGDGRVALVRVAKNSKLLTRVVIETMGGARVDAGRFYPNPARLVVAVGAAGTGAGAAVPVTPAVPEVVKALAAPPADSLADGNSSLTRALGLKIGRVVIDPGHGGHDSGTIGPTGIMEKSVVLDVSLRLGKLLRQRLGTQVVFTRDDDTFIPLDERTAIANREHADLFVSIHANSNPDHQMRGIETYYLDLNNNAQALAVAKRENASGDQDIHELTDMVRKITLNDKMEESHELARDVERSVVDATDEANHGVLTAPFVVLIGAQMPSVLAEITMLSNRSDDRLASTAAYRQRLAEGLYQGIRRYMQSLNGTHTMVAAPSVP